MLSCWPLSIFWSLDRSFHDKNRLPNYFFDVENNVSHSLHHFLPKRTDVCQSLFWNAEILILSNYGTSSKGVRHLQFLFFNIRGVLRSIMYVFNLSRVYSPQNVFFCSTPLTSFFSQRVINLVDLYGLAKQFQKFQRFSSEISVS